MGQKERTSAPPGIELKCFVCGGKMSIQFLDGAWTLACFPLNSPCGPVLRDVDADSLMRKYLTLAKDPSKIPASVMIPRKDLKGGIQLKGRIPLR